MTTIYDTDDKGNIIVIFDSRWRFPELLGYSVDDPQYRILQRMWEERTGKRIPREVAKTRRLTRDKVISVVKGKELVGVYWEGTDGSEILFECSPEKADRIIEIFNEQALEKLDPRLREGRVLGTSVPREEDERNGKAGKQQ